MNKEIRQILCVIDFAESSAKVLEVAAGIANACKTHLVVLYPYRLIDHRSNGNLANFKSQLENKARQSFQQLKDGIPIMENLSCEFQPEIGFLTDRINAHVKTLNFNMVILGQQQSVNTNEIKGFNLQQLISNSKLPFLIVPGEVNVAAISNID